MERPALEVALGVDPQVSFNISLNNLMSSVVSIYKN